MNFRKFIGKHDEKGCIFVGKDVLGIYINIYEHRGRKGLLDSTFYDIKSLIKEGELNSYVFPGKLDIPKE